MAARVAMMMVGSVISVSTRPPTIEAERGRPAKLMKIGETEDTEHDRRHGREIVDVDLDQVGPAVLRRELLADRWRRRRRAARPAAARSASCRASRPGATPMPAVSGWLEAPKVKRPVLKRFWRWPSATELVDPGELLVGELAPRLRHVAVDVPFMADVDVGRGQHPDGDRLAESEGCLSTCSRMSTSAFGDRSCAGRRASSRPRLRVDASSALISELRPRAAVVAPSAAVFASRSPAGSIDRPDRDARRA